ncbi:hypothetical protein A8C56_05260 [Niabella ginsenosidivorans]|uniref:ABC3 transporter permease protein domain-containing protein n=1 Tax=Niabella ginsenosidivorans TaxID=1176587 RepID=A0A1A9HYK5_9BACT|nr:hypothetical protein [Niabella ginsenosidivorans]ANH80477.1 hypothetical protein A8C56_05260 [Niabella ginsenosidivorans]
MLNDFKEQIVSAGRVNPTDNLVIVGNQSFHEKKVLDVDSDFFKLFSFPLIKRDAATVLQNPGNIVLTESLQSGIDLLKAEYRKVVPEYPFEYRFLDEQFGDLYKRDLRQQTVLTVFACLAIFVACLGWYRILLQNGLKKSVYEKVPGSSVQNIVILLSKDLLKPVLIASCIALPAGYWAMNKWLQNFAYKTTLSWWIFLLAILVTFGIALLTVGIKSVKAAMANPVRALRTE